MKLRFLKIAVAVGIVTASLSFVSLSFAAELTETKERGQIIVGVKDNLRPLGFTDAEGSLVGLEIDIARKLAEELFGNSEAVELVPISNKERLQVVLNNDVDLAIARIAYTTSRARIVDFSPHYYLDGTGLITKNNSIKNLDYLANATIAVLENSATIAVIRNRLPKANLIGVNSYQEALELLETNKAKAFAADRSVLTGWIQEYPQYKLLPERLSGVPLAIVMPKGLQYQELREQVNNAIARWQESGWLQERIKYWGL